MSTKKINITNTLQQACIHAVFINLQYIISYRYIISHSPEFYYSCGRTSQIWRVNSKAMLAHPSERVSVLARHKTAPSGYLEHRPQFVYSCGRSSPVWQPRTRSRSCPERPRTASLARPKQTHMDYKPNRQVRRLVLIVIDTGQ